ncbi:transmembrane protein, putative (macronuclear) [Tetrahymena thermophila SB210]|uniref:Transmembrane protein, putative n=1 Tax=Tetrahymena thermophila (strain SB210) TaxID=312017 RepID=Q24GQ3_TETTS|nr:transmembrane protein, putative [Tetrahymena thermophila SB210]EAS06954.2 transmembrane protein, putative [Tetrahymena thermophila SB210]|eukprot:XP_001027196.2 transmembrane protein, putative [Tetrahymena thermophila SB210]
MLRSSKDTVSVEIKPFSITDAVSILNVIGQSFFGFTKELFIIFPYIIVKKYKLVKLMIESMIKLVYLKTFRQSLESILQYFDFVFSIYKNNQKESISHD